MTPSPMPARSPACWAEASCSSSTHWSQHWKSISARVLGAELSNRRRIRVLQLRRPVGEPRPVMLAQHRPGGEVLQPGSLALPVAVEGELPAEAPRQLEDDLQRLPLGQPAACRDRWPPPGRIRPAPARRSRWTLARCSSARLGVLRDPLRAQVERVRKPAAGGKVRRRLQRRQRLGGVHGIDEHVVGAVYRGRPDCQVLQVGKITDPPGLCGADAVELGRQTPRTPIAHPVREAEPGRSDDQRHRCLVIEAACPQRVVAQR